MSYGMNNSTAGGKGSMREKIPSGYKKGVLQQFTPEQMELFQQLFSHLGPDSYLSKLAGGDESLFQEMEAPAMKQFSGLQGNLASRFSGMGMGARKSSGFQNVSNQAASDFAGQLQANRQSLQRQAIGDIMGYSNQLLNQRPFETSLVKQQQKTSPWGSFAEGLGGAIPGALAGFMTGGPGGAAVGGVGGFMQGMNDMYGPGGFNH